MLQTYINGSEKGKFALRYYKVHEKLNNDYRNAICDAIVYAELGEDYKVETLVLLISLHNCFLKTKKISNFICFRIKPKTMKTFAQAIIKLFPNENEVSIFKK